MQPIVIAFLRGLGHRVYDFRNPRPGYHGFSWHEVDHRIPVGSNDVRMEADRIIRALGQSQSERGFRSDMRGLEESDTCLLLLPCGRSAHLEAGWAAGNGKRLITWITDGEPELMWKLSDTFVTNFHELADAVGHVVHATEATEATES